MPTNGLRLSGSVVQPTRSVTVSPAGDGLGSSAAAAAEAPDQAGGERQQDEEDKQS